MESKIWKESIPFFRLAGVKKDRLNEIGYRVGIRSLELIMWREKNIRRETRILGVLYFINTTVWRTLFGKQADSLEKSTEHEDECTTLHIGMVNPC